MKSTSQYLSRTLHLTQWLLLASLTLSLVACDSDSGDDNDPANLDESTFEAAVGGDQMNGQAFYAISEEETDDGEVIEVFTIGMLEISGGDTSAIILGRPGETVPSPGEYDVVNLLDHTDDEGDFDYDFDGFLGVYYASLSGDNFNFLIATSGDVEITSTSGDRVAGSFTFDGSSFFGTETTDVSGSFNASKVEDLDEIPLAIQRVIERERVR